MPTQTSGLTDFVRRVLAGHSPQAAEAHAWLEGAVAKELMPAAESLTLEGFADTITYSRKVFIPLTQLCRDVCHYCTFAKAPRWLKAPYLSPDEVLAIARDGKALDCKEALFTLGDKPEERYATPLALAEANTLVVGSDAERFEEDAQLISIHSVSGPARPYPRIRRRDCARPARWTR